MKSLSLQREYTPGRQPFLNLRATIMPLEGQPVPYTIFDITRFISMPLVL